MMGETEEKWREAVRRAIELEPDSVTIYQMELPYNTTISRDYFEQGHRVANCRSGALNDTGSITLSNSFFAHDYEIAGTDIVATKKKTCRFIYRDALWHGGDMIGIGCLVVFAFRRRQFPECAQLRGVCAHP
jgi:oxygen-independent coproporphyrinogen-3 oxidase